MMLQALKKQGLNTGRALISGFASLTEITDKMLRFTVETPTSFLIKKPTLFCWVSSHNDVQFELIPVVPVPKLAPCLQREIDENTIHLNGHTLTFHPQT